MPKDTGKGQSYSLALPMIFKRRSGRKEIIVPDDSAAYAEPVAPPQEPLVSALAQARQWQEMLDSGEYKTANELAKHLNISTAYVTRMLRLNYLAPDIVEAILQGREPNGLSLTKLTEPLPAAWEEQREQLGFVRS